jgi:hypothetical protein
MKKLIVTILTLASFLLIAPEISPQTMATPTITNPQVRVEIDQRSGRYWRNRRTVTRTRYVRRGWRTYRETYAVTYLPNGRVRTELISRERVS